MLCNTLCIDSEYALFLNAEWVMPFKSREILLQGECNEGAADKFVDDVPRKETVHVSVNN